MPVPIGFCNEPLTDWSQEENRRKMQEAILGVRRAFGQEYPLVVGKSLVFTGQVISSVNPANYNKIVGLVSQANSSWVDKACQEAFKAWQDWQRVPFWKRVKYLFRAAELMRRRRFELAALVLFEVGKNWREADADIAEAIDFLEYYARSMSELGPPTVTQEVPGEHNETWRVPTGVWAVIGTWNFPFAINVGMVAAAIVAGNTVVFKPASASAVIGYKISEIFRQACLPDGVLNFLAGSGGEIGEELVRHPKVINVAFTGSKKVGLIIHRLCGQHTCDYGVKELRVGEFGGKGKIIIDSDADLDEAVKGAVDSAFEYCGQKCSAGPVNIVIDGSRDRALYNRFCKRLVEATESIKIGPPEEMGTFMGPLVGQGQLDLVCTYVQIGKSEGRLLYEGIVSKELAEQGYYHAPVILTDVSTKARIYQEEIFGPVLAVVRAENLDQAIGMFNDSEYALTGGIFSRLPSHCERAARECACGNFYINRKITGAIVGRQPFGGWKFSGVGSKAGGKNYLLRFMYEKTISENVMRRGYAPLP